VEDIQEVIYIRTEFLGEHIGLWLLMFILLSIVILVLYFGWMSGGVFGDCWHVSGNPSDPVYRECLRNLRP
jgi:hypothetical protein